MRNKVALTLKMGVMLIKALLCQGDRKQASVDQVDLLDGTQQNLGGAVEQL